MACKDRSLFLTDDMEFRSQGQTMVITYEAVPLFILLYKEVLTFETVYQTLMCDRSNESYL